MTIETCAVFMVTKLRIWKICVGPRHTFFKKRLQLLREKIRVISTTKRWAEMEGEKQRGSRFFRYSNWACQIFKRINASLGFETPTNLSLKHLGHESVRRGKQRNKP